ncbi:hypothetical protein BDV28DRAFT_144763 [Aspergillus coremiiformis]|uniref:Uncharacterized protein n=1 Tax=Aspergillus coremiiformis TaxID=138285 RepID=A0A5N6ZL02_9EURO|nr:hypothetical protein BDV28DRAFT_144763 [Aspergillus coremiiformis]
MSDPGFEDCEYLDDWDPSDPVKLDLYAIEDNEALAGQGALKSYHASENGRALFVSDKPSHHISVQRLLWVDGWEKTDAGEKTQEMTLVVLKAVFGWNDPKSRIQWAKMELALESTQDEADEPVVEAWAQFHEPEQWNQSTAQRKNTGTVNASADVGWNGSSATTGMSRTQEVSWEQTDYDEGTAWEKFSKRTGKPNGMTWTLRQNNLQDHGVKPEIWTAVLFARQSRAPYKVRFEMRVGAGNFQAFGASAKRLFGLSPQHTRAFEITPWKTPVVNGEGRKIVEHIDLNNLGKLRDREERTKLNVQWGGINPASAQPPLLSSQQGIKSDVKPDMRLDVGLTATPDPSRLVALETRMAQLEARVATQDTTILQLQRALLEETRAQLG